MPNNFITNGRTKNILMKKAATNFLFQLIFKK